MRKRKGRAEGRMKGSSKERAAGRSRGNGNTAETRKGRAAREPEGNKGHEHGRAREGEKRWRQQEACEEG